MMRSIRAACLAGTMVLVLLPNGAAADPAGGRVWAARYAGPGNGDDFANSIAVSPDATRAYVTGRSGSDYATVSYDVETGAQIWAARYNGPANSTDVAKVVAVSPDGTRVYVSGDSWSGTKWDYATVAYAADTGAEIWAAHYNGPANLEDRVSSLKVSPDGSRVYVTGTAATIPFPNYWDFGYATVAYAASTGTQKWVAHYNGRGYWNDTATSMAVSPDGSRVYVTGGAMTYNGYREHLDYATVAYDSDTGAVIWRVQAQNDAGDVIAYSIAVSPDGSRVYVTGGGSDYGYGGNLYGTVAYDASTGAQTWIARYGGLGNRCVSYDDVNACAPYDSAHSVSLSPDGARVYVMGDHAVLAYDAATGTQRWVAGETTSTPYGIYDGARKTAFAVSPDGARVYVTGSKSDLTNDYETVAYETATGRQTWAARYVRSATNGEFPSDAAALAVSPDGARVYLTGGSGGDYVTLAYNTALCAPGRYEDGPVTTSVHGTVEPAAGEPIGPALHDVSCTAAGEGL